MSILESIISESSSKVVRVENNPANINWQRGAGDVCELNGRTGAAAGNSRASLAKIDGQIAVVYADYVDAWHELGTMVRGAMTLAELFAACPALDFTLDQEPVFWTDPATGHHHHIEKLNCVVLTSKTGKRHAFSGVGVGERQELINPRESLAFLDAVLGTFGAHYETAGAIDDGRKIFVSATMPEHFEPVPGDVVQNIVSLTDAYDASERMRLFQAEQRMVCKNTRRIAMREGVDFCSFKHTASIREKMARAESALGKSRAQWNRYRDVATQMVRAEVNPEHYVSDVLDCVLDITAADAKRGASALAAALDVSVAERELAEKRFSKKIENRADVLGEILNTHYGNKDTNTAPGTVWGAYNAVTEYANHGLTYRGNERKQQETRFDSVLTGRADQISQAAYAIASDLVA